MPGTFRGSCPICSKQLLVDDESSETASCYCPENHYSCAVKDFNRLWEEFDAQARRLGQQKASVMYSEKLLEDLRALNTAKRTKELLKDLLALSTAKRAKER